MSPLRILSISDIHLGHARVPTEFIIDNLNKYMLQDSIFRELDICYLAGDVFDRLQSLPDTSVPFIQVWMVKLLRMCKRHDVQLRVLEGTPSHDRNQSTQFTVLNELCEIGTDLLYVDTVYIEHNEKHNIDVLYVPDRYHATTAETLTVFDELLKEHNLEKVDYAIMHGMFPHQLPPGLDLPSHDPDAYLARVRKYIFVGHVHQSSVCDRIISQGSTDRLCHNEEEDKGFWLVTSNRDTTDGDTLTFVVNKGAKIFKAIDLTTTPGDNVSQLINDRVAGYPTDSHFQIKIMKDDERKPLFDAVIKNNPDYNWKYKWVKDEVATTTDDIAPQTYQSTVLSAETIPTLLEGAMGDIEASTYNPVLKVYL